MEIQTFMLSERVEKVAGSNPSVYNCTNAGIYYFFPKNGQFPLEFSCPCLMVLRRQECNSDKHFILRFSLLDTDGRKTGMPNNLTAKGIFPKKAKFLTIHESIGFSFPKPGEYRLDITDDEDIFPHLYSYNIEIGESR